MFVVGRHGKVYSMRIEFWVPCNRAYGFRGGALGGYSACRAHAAGSGSGVCMVWAWGSGFRN